MSKTTFAKLIIAKLTSILGTNGAVYTSDTPVKAQQAIAEAITEYLTANTTITILYNGILTSGTGNDTIVSDTMNITGKCSTISQPTNFQNWVNNIQTSIAISFTVISPGKNGVVTSFKPFNPTFGMINIQQNDLHSIHQKYQSTPTLPIWTFICGKILDWLNSELGKNTAALNIPATRTGISSGMASLKSIVVS